MVYSDDWIGANLFVNGDYEASIFERALAFTSQVLPEHEKVFVDVGANIGVHSRRMAALGYKTYSFEPNPNAFRLLGLNAGKDCEIFQLALGSDVGKVKMFERSPQNLGNTQSIQVDESSNTSEELIDMSTLDLERNSLPKTGIVKIDVEGGELEVLKGGLELLVRDRPAVFFEQLKEEFDQPDSSPSIRFLRQLGFTVYCLHSRNILSRSLDFALSLTSHQSRVRPNTKLIAGNHPILVAIYESIDD